MLYVRHSCGVYMLLAIKHNADRFVESVHLVNVPLIS